MAGRQPTKQLRNCQWVNILYQITSKLILARSNSIYLSTVNKNNVTAPLHRQNPTFGCYARSYWLILCNAIISQEKLQWIVASIWTGQIKENAPVVSIPCDDRYLNIAPRDHLFPKSSTSGSSFLQNKQQLAEVTVNLDESSTTETCSRDAKSFLKCFKFLYFRDNTIYYF